MYEYTHKYSNTIYSVWCVFDFQADPWVLDTQLGAPPLGKAVCSTHGILSLSVVLCVGMGPHGFLPSIAWPTFYGRHLFIWCVFYFLAC